MPTPLSGFEGLDGHAWEDLCMRVLQVHHGPGELTVIPDDDRGDNGVEAYAQQGHVYACYAPQLEPLTAAQRRTKQIDKINRDVGKFITKKNKLAAMFPPGFQARRWILLVPRITTKDLHTRASQLTADVRAASLPYADASIVVTAQTLESLPVATRTVVENQLVTLKLPTPDLTGFGDIEDPQVKTINSKLAKTRYFQDPTRRRDLVDRLLKNMLAGQAHRQYVGDHFSELGDELDAKMSDLESRLAVQFPLDHPDPDNLLSTVLKAAEETVTSNLNTADAESRVIAEGQVAEWLMRCPLDFP